MKKILLTLVPVLLFGAFLAPLAHADSVTLDQIWVEIVQLRNEVANLKSQIQSKSPIKKTLKKIVKSPAVTNLKGNPVSGNVLPYDIYAVAFRSSDSKIQLWALDSTENLVMVGTINTNSSLPNPCPYASGHSLAMDSNKNLYLTANNGSSINTLTTHLLTCDASTNICSCTDVVPSLATSGIGALLWGTAIVNMYGADNFVMGVNAGSGTPNNQSSFNIAALTAPVWANLPLVDPNGVQLAGLKGDITQVGPDTILTNIGGNNVNSFLTMNNPSLTNIQNIGLSGAKVITGLATKIINDKATVYSFTNAPAGSNYGRVWRHKLNSGNTEIMESEQIAQLPPFTSFHDAASAPIYQAPLTPPPPPPESLPDLVVSNLTFFTYPPNQPHKWYNPTTETVMTVTTKNVGSSAVTLPAGYHIALYKDSVSSDNKLSSFTLNAPVILQPGGTYVKQINTVLHVSKFPAPGTYDIVAKTDTWEGVVPSFENQVVESNEDNNTFVKPITLVP